MDYDQIDIFNHKTFLSNLSPKSQYGHPKKQQQQNLDQGANQNNNRPLSNVSSTYKPFSKNQFFDIQQRNFNQNKQSSSNQQPQSSSDARQTSVDSYSKNKENFNNSLSKIFFNSPRYKAQLSKMTDSAEIQQKDTHQVSQQEAQQKYAQYMSNSSNSIQKQHQETSLACSAVLNNPNSRYFPRRDQASSESVKNSTNTSLVKQKNQNNTVHSDYKSSMVLTKNISLNKADTYNNNKGDSYSSTDRLILSSNSNQFDFGRQMYSSTTKNAQANQSNQYGGNRPGTSGKRESKDYFEFQKDSKQFKQNNHSANRPSSGKDFGKRPESHDVLDFKREKQQNYSSKNSDARKSYVQQEEQKQTNMRDSQHQEKRSNTSGKFQQPEEKQEKRSAIFQSSIQSHIPKPQVPTSQSQVINVGTSSPKVNNFMDEQPMSNSKQPPQPQIQPDFIKKSSSGTENSKSQPHTNKNNKNSGEKRESKFKNEYQEYKKLQEKLNYLESKIMSIKTNIDSNQKKDFLTNNKNKEKHNEKSDKKENATSLKSSLNCTPNYKSQEYKKNYNSKNSEKEDIEQQQQQQQQQQSAEKASLSNFITQVNKGSASPIQSNSKLTDSKQKSKLKLEEKSSTAHKPFVNVPKTTQNNSQMNFFMKQGKEEEENGENQQNLSKNSGKNSTYLNRDKTTMSSQSLRNSSVQSQQFQRNQQYQQQQPQFIYYISTIIKSYMNPNDQSYQMQLAREHLLQTVQAVNFAKMLKPPNQKVLHEKKVYLPTRRDNKKTLVFDLDETLIHCNESTNIPADVVLPIKFPTGEIIEAGINIRPYTMKCLQEMSKFFELIVFTASHSCYANVVLDYLDPHGEYIQHRLFRENCVQTEEGVFIKDLRVLQNRNLSEIIIVDNAAYSFGYQIDNGLPIFPFYDNKNDIELKHLMSFVKNLQNVKDVREGIRNSLKLNMFNEFSDPIELMRILFEDLIK